MVGWDGWGWGEGRKAIIGVAIMVFISLVNR